MKKVSGFLMTLGGACTAIGMLLAGQMPTNEQWIMLGGAITGGLTLLKSAYKKIEEVSAPVAAAPVEPPQGPPPS